MGLTLSLSAPEFDKIFRHLATHRPEYANMHLREARQINEKRALRYLQVMRIAPGSQRALEGMISGPTVFVQYRIFETVAGIHFHVLSERGQAKEKLRLIRRFGKEMLKRVTQEQAGNTHYPKYLTGQYYLRRSKNGQPASHGRCIKAVETGTLDAKFVAALRPWGFSLLCGA